MIAVRRAGTGDAGAVGGLVDRLLAELSGKPLRLAEREVTAARLLGMEGRAFGFLAFDAEAAVGVMMVSESLSIYASGAFGVITELFVLPEARSAGVAPLLIAAGVALGRERGWPQLEVGAPSQPKWARSLGFYLGNGFVEVGPRLRLGI